jgi:hypothetical protein
MFLSVHSNSSIIALGHSYCKSFQELSLGLIKSMTHPLLLLKSRVCRQKITEYSEEKGTIQLPVVKTLDTFGFNLNFFT